MMNLPFPYKLLSTDEIHDGSVFDIPKFCRQNQKKAKCKQFYASIIPSGSFTVCPYGFCAKKCCLGDREVIFTCLNIEKLSNRKEVQKRIKDSEFIPRITESKYLSLVEVCKDTINESKVDLDNQIERAKVSEEREALANVMHELKNLINQLTSRADKLSDECQRYHPSFERISTLSTNVYALSNLMSVRIDSYNLEVDPSKFEDTEKIEICIFKKIEKAYKCLQSSINEKHLRVNLNNNSYNRFEATSLLEIGFFIILENAVKYAPAGSDIDVDFYENDSQLEVKFTNWGIKPLNGEISMLANRGYRSQRVRDYKTIKGRGLGLYLLSIICEMHNVQMNYVLGKETRSFHGDGFVYSPFILSLEFSNMIIQEDNK